MMCLRRIGKREFYYTVSKTPLKPPPTRKRGRPSGSKNKSKKKKKSTKKNEQGRRGLFKVFYNGKRGYVKVDPYRMTLRFSKNINPKIVATLKELLGLFIRKMIQNNVAEGSNNVIQSLLKLSGPKTESSLENKIRALVMIQNEPKLLNEVQIERNTRGDFMINGLISPELAHLMSQGCTLERK